MFPSAACMERKKISNDSNKTHQIFTKLTVVRLFAALHLFCARPIDFDEIGTHIRYMHDINSQFILSIFLCYFLFSRRLSVEEENTIQLVTRIYYLVE